MLVRVSDVIFPQSIPNVWDGGLIDLPSFDRTHQCQLTFY